MKNAIKAYSSLFFILVVVCTGYAQVSFIGGDFEIDGKTFTSGAPMGCADVNGDGLDDLLILDKARDLFVVYQTNGFGGMYSDFLRRVSTDVNWAIQVADVNEDDVMDIFVANALNRQIFYGAGVQPHYTSVRLPGNGFLPQAANFVDMDEDGDLDLFVCNDLGTNYIALNDGAGHFVQVDTLIDFTTDPASDNSGNYGSVWCDYDRDGDQDLYIAKCRGAAPPGDPRRTNQFFKNTPEGFEPIVDFPDLLSNDQSWAADFVDVDNDGDWDLLVANHDAPMNLFMQQSDGSFIDEAQSRGIDFEAGVIQLVSADYDNDGDVDVFVAGSNHILYLNDGTGHFSVGTFPEDLVKQIESAVCGDFNGDGAIDIYAGFADIYNDPTNIPDQLFINHSIVGNYMKVLLRSDSFNTRAIGATVEIYHGDKFQMREIRSGESYGINKSSNIHFGLDTFSRIDSMVIYWPSGGKQTLTDIDANSAIYIHENDGWTSTTSLEIASDKPALCPDDSVKLSAPIADTYAWSTGETSPEITVDSAGIYYVQIIRDGIQITCPVFYVEFEDSSQPVVGVNGRLKKCSPDTIELLAKGNAQYPILWNDGQSDRSIEVSSEGAYFFVEIGYCADYNSDTVRVENYPVSSITTTNDTVVSGSRAVLYSSSEQTFWISDTISGMVYAEGDSIEIFNLTEDSTVFAASYSVNPSTPEQIGVPNPDTMRDGYHHPTLNFATLFHTEEDCFLESVSVFTRTAGIRDIIIRDALTWEEFHRISVDVQRGWNVLSLNAELISGQDYEIITDEQVNVDNLGMQSPDFMRTNGVNYPFEGQSLTITANSVGSSSYYYFYDWQVSPKDKICLGPWQPVHAVVDSVVNTVDVEDGDIGIRFYPNPTFGELTVHNSTMNRVNSSVYNSTGQLVGEWIIEPVSQSVIYLRTPGLYLMRSETEDGKVHSNKIIVSDNIR